MFFAVVLTVAVCEEIIYRGFAQRAFEDWSGGMIVAGIVGSSAMFAVAHLYQGPRGVITTLIVGILLSAIRAWTGSLMAPFVAHFIAIWLPGSWRRHACVPLWQAGTCRRLLLHNSNSHDNKVWQWVIAVRSNRRHPSGLWRLCGFRSSRQSPGVHRSSPSVEPQNLSHHGNRSS